MIAYEDVRGVTFPNGTEQLIQSFHQEDGFYHDLILTENNELLFGDEYLPF